MVVDGAGYRLRPIPPLARAMYYYSGADWPSALRALSPAERLRECLISRFGWNGVRNATGCSEWVHAIFNRYEPGDNSFPTHASMRVRRSFEGVLRVAPLSYLEDVALGDWLY